MKEACSWLVCLLCTITCWADSLAKVKLDEATGMVSIIYALPQPAMGKIFFVHTPTLKVNEQIVTGIKFKGDFGRFEPISEAAIYTITWNIKDLMHIPNFNVEALPSNFLIEAKVPIKTLGIKPLDLQDLQFKTTLSPSYGVKKVKAFNKALHNKHRRNKRKVSTTSNVQNHFFHSTLATSGLGFILAYTNHQRYVTVQARSREKNKERRDKLLQISSGLLGAAFTYNFFHTKRILKQGKRCNDAFEKKYPIRPKKVIID